MSIPFGIVNTSERTVEVNILHDLAKCLESKKQVVTIISPSQREENELGFDDMFHGLRAGRILALQFKKPYEKDLTNAKFHISVDQLRRLKDHFPNYHEAYYVFCPLPTTTEFVEKRETLLESSSILEIHNNSLRITSRAKSRTIEICKSNPISGKIIERRRRLPISDLELSSVLCPKFFSGIIGREFKPSGDKKLSQEPNIEKYNKSNLPGKTFYVHITKRLDRRY